MASAGPLYPGTAAEDSGVGTASWNDVNNAKANDGSVSFTLGDSGQQSHYLKVTNFGFSIPDGSTINGIVVEINKAAGDLTSKDFSVRLCKSGSFVGSNYASGTTWGTGYTFASYGTGITDLWGTTWTVSEINDTGFGVGLSVQWFSGSFTVNSVDSFRITVYYTAGGSGIAAIASHQFRMRR